MRELTLEEELACRDHLDALLEITSGLKFSSIFDTLKQQMQLTTEDERLILGVIQKEINNAIWSSFAQTGERLKQMLNNPVMQAEIREQIDKMKTPKGGSEVEVPTE